MKKLSAFFAVALLALAGVGCAHDSNTNSAAPNHPTSDTTGGHEPTGVNQSGVAAPNDNAQMTPGSGSSTPQQPAPKP